MIKGLQESFPDKIIGYSDHTLPDKEMTCLLNACLLGAKILEKHFTFDKNLKGNDHYHSMDVNDLKTFNRILKKSFELTGLKTKKEVLPEEEISRKNARRSLVVKLKLKSGHILSEDNLICKRPGTGISPINLEKVIGKKLKNDLEEDHILCWEDIT